MGPDLGRAVLTLARTCALTGAFAAVLSTVGPQAASADGPTPTPAPTQVSTPSLSPPSQEQIDDARAALERLRDRGSTRPPAIARVAGPTADDEPGSFASRISDETWWTIGAGLLVLLVASETTRLSVRRAKHRKGA